MDLDGLGGTKKNTIVEAKVIDSRPHSMRACKGLVSERFHILNDTNYE